MENSIIFTSPFIILLIVALGCSLFDVVRRTTGYVLPTLSIFLTIITLTYATLLGAKLYETALVFIIFATVNLFAFGERGGRK